MDSKEKDRFAFSILAVKWIGLRYASEDRSSFVWIPQRTALVYTNWRQGEPDDYPYEHCAILQVSGYWNDYRCGVASAFICEKPGGDDLCNAGWTAFDKNCYLISSERLPWTESRLQCQSMGSDLVVIETEAENNFLEHKLSNEAWIGLNDWMYEGEWVWSDRSLASTTWQNWDYGQPDNNMFGIKDCASISADNGLWRTHSCTVHLAVICERSDQLYCDSGWKRHGNSCYLFHPGQLQQKAARQYCQHLSADLVVIDDDDENQFLNTSMDQHSWIGLADSCSDGT